MPDSSYDDELMVEQAPETDEDSAERGGIYLMAFAAFALPGLIVLAAFLPASPVAISEHGDTRTLDSIALDQSTIPPPTSVTTPLIATDTTSLDDNAFDDNAFDITNVEVAGTIESATTSGLPSTSSPAQVSVTSPATSPTVEQETPGSTSVPTPESSTPNSQIPSTTRPAVTTTTTPPTTIVASTTPATTTSIAAPSTAPAAVENAPNFIRTIEVGLIEQSSVRLRFSADADTPYSVVATTNGEVASNRSGNAANGQVETIQLDGLTPGVSYTIVATLDGQTSTQATVRTSGAPAQSETEQIQLLNVNVSATGSTWVHVTYQTNVCSNGSFVIRDANGTQVGSNAGQANGCTTQHLAIPGQWTQSLQPGSTYTLAITAEANGAGLGDGNTHTTTITVQTSN